MERIDLTDGTPRWLGQGTGGAFVELIGEELEPEFHIVKSMTLVMPASASVNENQALFDEFWFWVDLATDLEGREWFSGALGDYPGSGDYEASREWTKSSPVGGDERTLARFQVASAIGIFTFVVEAVEP